MLKFILLATASWLGSLFLGVLMFVGIGAAAGTYKHYSTLFAGYAIGLFLELGLAVLVVFLAAPRLGIATAPRLVVTLVLGSVQLVTFALLAFVAMLGLNS